MRGRFGRHQLSYVYVAIGALVLLAAFWLLYPVRHVEGFGTQLRINVGSNLLDVSPAALPHAFHPDHEVSVSGDGRKRYVLTEASRETLERAAALYAAKYGPGQGTVLLRLTDR